MDKCPQFCQWIKTNVFSYITCGMEIGVLSLFLPRHQARGQDSEKGEYIDCVKSICFETLYFRPNPKLALKLV